MKKSTLYNVEDFAQFWQYLQAQKRLWRAKESTPDRRRIKTLPGNFGQNKTAKPL